MKQPLSSWEREDQQLLLFSSDLQIQSYSKCPTFKCPTFKCRKFKCPIFKCLAFKCPIFKCPTFKYSTLKCPTFKCPTFKCPIFKCPTFNCKNSEIHGHFSINVLQGVSVIMFFFVFVFSNFVIQIDI